MGQNRVILGRSAPLFAGGELIEGILVVNVPGATAQRFPIGDVLDSVRRYSNDIPDPGVASFAFNFNPADPKHLDLLKKQKDGETVKFEWVVQGEKVNGVNTKNGDPVGNVTIASIVDGGKTGKLAWSSVTVDEPRIGDILVKGAVKLRVLSAVHGEDAVIVENSDSKTNLAAISANTVYAIEKPATVIQFGGQISGIPMQGGQVVTANAQVTISGKIAFVTGDPDITA